MSTIQTQTNISWWIIFL